MFALISLFALAAVDLPSNGDIMRELRTDPDAFERADINRDGVISDLEFDKYKTLRRREAMAAATPPSNGDGESSETDDKEELRACTRDGYYYIDDRDGRVYCDNPQIPSPDDCDEDAEEGEENACEYIDPNSVTWVAIKVN